MLQTPLWKRILIWATVALGLVLAAPNLFYTRVEGHNDAAKAVEAAGFATVRLGTAVAAGVTRADIPKMPEAGRGTE